MAKPQPQEYCRIICDNVPLVHVGPIMAQLSKMGLTDVHTDFVTTVPKFAQRTNHEVSAQTFLTDWIKDHPTFRAKEVVHMFEDAGRTAGAAYTALRVMTKDGVLKMLGEGNYSRADVKAIASATDKTKKVVKTAKAEPGKVTKKTVTAKQTAKPVKAARTTMKHYQPSHADFILRAAGRNHGRFSRSWMKTQFENANRPSESASPTILALVAAGRLKRVGEGEYVLLREGSKAVEAAAEPATTAEVAQ